MSNLVGWFVCVCVSEREKNFIYIYIFYIYIYGIHSRFIRCTSPGFIHAPVSPSFVLWMDLIIQPLSAEPMCLVSAQIFWMQAASFSQISASVTPTPKSMKWALSLILHCLPSKGGQISTRNQNVRIPLTFFPLYFVAALFSLIGFM